MTAYDLPFSVEVGGKSYPIRYGWRAIIDILAACSDPDLDEYSKAEVVLSIFYQDMIPPEHLEEALQKANDFIDHGNKQEKKLQKKMMDWQQDADIIIPAINQCAGCEIRLDPSIHWWTVLGWFMAIEKGVFSSVLYIRDKLAKCETLSKPEKEFYLANRRIVDLINPDTPEETEAKNELLAWMEGDKY